MTIHKGFAVNMSSIENKSTLGRRRKFEEPSRPITITLPERTLRLLTSIHADRARAIAKATDAATSQGGKGKLGVRLVEVGSGTALILVGPSATLRRIPFLRLVEIAPLRYLLVLPTGTPLEKLEVAIADQMESLASCDDYERSVLVELRSLIRSLRHEKRMMKAEIILVEPKDAGTGKEAGQRTKRVAKRID